MAGCAMRHDHRLHNLAISLNHQRIVELCLSTPPPLLCCDLACPWVTHRAELDPGRGAAQQEMSRVLIDELKRVPAQWADCKGACAWGMDNRMATWSVLFIVLFRHDEVLSLPTSWAYLMYHSSGRACNRSLG